MTHNSAGGFPSFCIYGPSGSGKTPQIGIFARRLFRETGGKIVDGKPVGGARLRLYTADRGGFDSILPEIELGLIQLVDLKDRQESPWIWIMKAIQARVVDKDGKWSKGPVLTDTEGNKILGWAFEGLTEVGYALRDQIKIDRAAGINVGGGTVDARMEATDEEGESFDYAGHARSDYMMGQDKMDSIISRSMRLPGYVIWTALDLRSSDTTTVRQVVGPDVGVGSKLTAKMPQKFTYTWRTVNMAKKGDEQPKYRLYLVTHADPNMAGVTGVCNARYPKDTPDDKRVSFIEPADMAEAYVKVKEAREAAKAAILANLS